MRKLLSAAALLLFAGFSFAQTVESGGVVMIHELKHNMDDEAYKNFMKDWEETFMPAFMPLMEKYGEMTFVARDWYMVP